VDDDGNFAGLIILDKIRDIIFKPELYETTYVCDLMETPDVTVHPDELMADVVQKFQKTGKFNIPVLDEGKYLGFISRANVFSVYRRLLKEFSDD
jgi:CIC family chloride channel protein